MRAYMAWDGLGGPEEGAVLVFANNSRQARVLAYPEINGWTDCGFINVRTKWLRDDCEHMRVEDGPHLVTPPVCRHCELWHTEPLNENGECQGCAEWFDNP